MTNALLQIHPDDNVLVAIRALDAGHHERGLVTAAIPMGHKVALRTLRKGELIVKYGFPIGRATDLIAPGEHVHSHNMGTDLGSDTTLRWTPGKAVAPPPTQEIPVFRGYRRPNGKVATRNEIWIINTVACVNVASQQIAQLAEREFRVQGSTVDGIHAFTHPYGCSQLGDDLQLTRKILSGLVQHPNAAGVLIIGLGCENNTLKSFLQEIGSLDANRIKFFNAQEVGDEIAHGLAMVRELVDYASQFHREPIPVSELVLGMKCGGSDGFSGITANPLVGRIADKLTGLGGTAILTEVPEMFGAEAPLFARCQDQETFDAAVSMVNSFKDYFRKHNEPIYENPSPGNKDGGITTLEEKSLGCIQKGGHAPVKQIAPYGAAAMTSLAGLCLVQAPGNDGVSCTALAAAGAHCLLFTTGRGTPLGVPTPTIKIATNSELAARKPNWIDFDAGILLQPDVNSDDVTEALWEKILAVASGEPARNEIQGFREITIWKQGVTL